jgi:GT2 family glycosyltransferase
VADPGVCSVIVNWNGRGVLDRCLATLIASSYQGLTVVVVDNASSDGSQELVRESYPSVLLIENAKNLGYAGGVNAGLRYAMAQGAEYALLLNNDTEIAPDAVELLVEAMEKRPKAAIAGPMIYYYDPPDVIWSLGGKISFWSGDIRHVAIREHDEGRYRTVREADYVTGCAMLVRLAAVREIGLMDEGYWMYNEDTDWCVRAGERGYSIIVVPAAKVWHKVSASSGGGLTAYKVYHRLRSTLFFFAVHARWYHWLGIVPATAGRALAFIARQLVAGRKDTVVAVLKGARDSVMRRERSPEE